MGRTHLPPDQFAKACGGWNDQFFKIRVSQEDDMERLREAVKYEAENKQRTDRIGYINERIQQVQNGD